MQIKYESAEDIKKEAEKIVSLLQWSHIDLEHVAFLRSHGSKTRRTIARCHALGKAMQMGMGRKKGFYLIEVIAERFDKLSGKEKIKTILHELMHIPKSFGGGFIHHNKVNERRVKIFYDLYEELKETSVDKKEKWF